MATIDELEQEQPLRKPSTQKDEVPPLRFCSTCHYLRQHCKCTKRVTTSDIYADPTCASCFYNVEHCVCRTRNGTRDYQASMRPRIVEAATSLDLNRTYMDTYAPDSIDSRVTVMGPVRPPTGAAQSPADTYSRWRALPPGKVFTCHIRHTGVCSCQPPVIVRPDMEETCNSSIMYLLSVLKKTPQPGRLSQVDLDFLAWSVSKMAAHWGRLALGQQDLV